MGAAPRGLSSWSRRSPVTFQRLCTCLRCSPGPGDSRSCACRGFSRKYEVVRPKPPHLFPQETTCPGVLRGSLCTGAAAELPNPSCSPSSGFYTRIRKKKSMDINPEEDGRGQKGKNCQRLGSEFSNLLSERNKLLTPEINMLWPDRVDAGLGAWSSSTQTRHAAAAGRARAAHQPLPAPTPSLGSPGAPSLLLASE